MGIALLLSVMLALLLGAATRFGLQRRTLPYSIALLLMGMLFGGLHDYLPQSARALTDEISHLDAHLLLFIFLPPLIFESAQGLEPHLFRRLAGQISLLAVPGLLIATGLTALLSRWWMGWDWPLALLFGALISATDPVAVVSLLKEMCSRKRLETLIEGESLLNDGTAIVLVALFAGLLHGEQTGPLTGIVRFIWVVSLSGLLGWLWGALLMGWIRRISNQPLIEVTLSIASAYLVYYVAEFVCHASGVVAVVALALTSAAQGRASFSPHVYHFMHQFWEMVAFIANTLLFLLMGMLVIQSELWTSWSAWLSLLIFYLGILVIRGITLTGLTPLLSLIGIGITREKLLVLWWGGLRGAVALLLAISVVHEGGLSGEQSEQLLFFTAGLVVLTIVINGISMRRLLLHLGLDKLPPAKQASLGKAAALIDQRRQTMLQTLHDDPRFARVDWQHLTPLVSPCLSGEASPAGSSHEEVHIAYLRRLLETERELYWQAHRGGWISGTSARILAESVDKALDDQPDLARPELINQLQEPKAISLMSSVPVLDHISQRLYRHQLLQSYELALQFCRAMQAMEEPVAQLAPDDAARQRAEAALKANNQYARGYCEMIQTEYPKIASRVESQIASRRLLAFEHDEIEKLQEKGVLSDPEAEQLLEQLEHRLRETEQQFG